MAQEVSPGNGEALAADARPPQWLIDLKAKAEGMRERRERPAGLAFGRWLGDFLDRETESGLLPAEEKLLFAAAQGEACVLQSRAARLWAAFEAWRKKVHRTILPVEEGFAEAMTQFLAGAPEAVQEVVHEATIAAFLELGLPADWEPKSAEEAEKLAQAQQEYFARLAAEANPPALIAAAKNDEGFYLLAVETVLQAPAGARDAAHSDALDLSEETQAKIDEQPRVLRDFFAELVWHVRREPGTDQAFLTKLKADPEALRPHFDAAFQRYEREQWRWVDPDDTEVRIRASFLRFLCIGGDDAAPVHERRLEVRGAYVEEDLDLSGCIIPQPLLFFRSHFAGQVLLKDADTKSLDFQKSHVRSVYGESAHIRGAIFLHGGFRATAGVSFPYANIEGRLSGEGSTFLSGGGSAINCSGARIYGDVGLQDGFLGEGQVVFINARIGGDLLCSGGTFRNHKEDGSGVALGCGGAEITGDALLSDGFQAIGCALFQGAMIGGALDCRLGSFINRTADGTGVALACTGAVIAKGAFLCDGFSGQGEVKFYRTHVRGDLLCIGGRFDNSAADKSDDSSTWTPRAASALNLIGARIDGTLWMGPHGGDAHARADIAGSVYLSGSHAHVIVDHPSSWPSEKVLVPEGKKLPALIYSDGFTYDRMGGSGDYSTATRKRWLDRQPPGISAWDLGRSPSSSSSRSTARWAMRAMLVKSRNSRSGGGGGRVSSSCGMAGVSRPRLFAPLNWLAWPFAIARRAVARSIISVLYALEWLIVGFGTAYGYGYFRLSAFLIALWLAGGFIYASASNQGAFAPSNPVIYLNAELREKCAKNWTDCKGAPPELPSFSPLTYSLDVMLPVLDLGQKRDWQPVSRTDQPVKVVLPFLGGLPGRDLKDRPEIVLGEGALDNIVRGQTLLSWAALGLLALMLSGLIKKD